MKNFPRLAWTGTACLAVAMTLVSASAQHKDDKSAGPVLGKDQDARPKLTLKAQPMMAIAPARVVFSAELVGGTTDLQDYYCPTVEWAWGDDTRSESTSDCEPYEAGKSEIKRRFTVEHQFKHGGRYKIVFRLKRGTKAIATASINVEVRPGLRDIGG
jgi:hypothetical protein